jgi:signal transduction histidine kinase
MVLTPQLVMAAASDAYLQATLTKRDEIVGRGVFDVFPDNPDESEASAVDNSRASVERVLRTGVADAMAVQQHDIRRPDAEGGGFEQRFWSPHNAPVFDRSGKLVYILHSVDNVTEFVPIQRHRSAQGKLTGELRDRVDKMQAQIYVRAQEISRANEQLRDANAELDRLYHKTKELDELKTHFFANISHELRTPLTLIIGPTQKMLSAPTLDDPIRSGLDVVLRNARLLHRRVDDLLELSKLDAGKLTLESAPADLATLTRATAGYFESLAQERGIAFEVCTDQAVFAEIDAEKLQRVLINLFSNAFKFTAAGGRIRCSLRYDGPHRQAIVEVADSGPEIAREHRELIFERFRQVDGGSARAHGGTGLGLAIARELIELHGGTLSVGRAPEGGALFSAVIPNAEMGAGPTHAWSSPAMVADAAPTSDSRRRVYSAGPRHDRRGCRQGVARRISGHIRVGVCRRHRSGRDDDAVRRGRPSAAVAAPPGRRR